MRRFLRFVRSLLPAEATQLGLISGVVCLLIASHLRWFRSGMAQTEPKSGFESAVIVFVAICAISLSGCAGYFVLFRPGRHPVRRLLSWVCFPALLGLTIMYSAFVNTAEVGSSWSNRIDSVLLKLEPGFHYALLGFVLVSAFTLRVALGSASLPLALPKSSVSASDDFVSWRRVEIFVWLLLALLPTIHRFFPFMNFIYYFVDAHIPNPEFKHTAGALVQLGVTNAMIVLVAIWVIGEEAWHALRRSLRWPAPDSLALAIAFPVGIAVLISLGQFLFGLLHWTTYRSATLPPPHIGSYFTLPAIWLLLFFPAALAEEALFRGVLQPRFIRRYGLLRGIFLLGIVFAATHFSADFSVGFTDVLVILKLCARLTESLALSFVAGWLTVRTGSMLPAAVAHGLFNILVFSPLGPQFFGIGPLLYLLWSVLAYVLFRYWPVQSGSAQESALARTGPDRL
jgi:membrane protease YdiL (CAAX protease family)